MNKNYWFFLIFCVLLFTVLGCEKVLQLENTGIKNMYVLPAVTRGVDEVENTYFVEEKDIQNYASFKKNRKDESAKNNELKNIIPLKWNGEICLYVLEYKIGYEILSADKRSQVPLVKDHVGKFEPVSEESPLGFHIYSLAEDVWFSLYKNELLDEPDKEATEKINASLLFWNLINCDYETIQSFVQTKSDPSSVVLDPVGHWEQIDLSVREIVYDTVGHLVPTWWTQNPPFNNYCPYYTTTSSSRCPAGCVAVAGAQVLNYLHYKLGVPEKSPSHGMCTGYVYNNTVIQSFTQPSEGTWNDMEATSDPKGYAAMLIGDVGQKVNMKYGATGSGANTLDLKEYVFKEYGISCINFSYYNGNFLRGDLERGIPVICAGHREVTSRSGEVSTVGHAFIVDSYIRHQEELTFTYQWTFDNPELNPDYPIIRTSVAYRTPYITHYQMNWGYGYDSNYNNVWCSMSGSWQYGSRTPYIHNRKMVCSFSVLND